MIQSQLQITVVPSGEVTGKLRDELVSLCSRAYAEDFDPYLRLLSPAVHVLDRRRGVRSGG